MRKTSKHAYHALCISCVNKGKKRTEETKVRMSAAQKGRTLTEKHKAKISAANKGENNHNYKGGKKVNWAKSAAKRKRQLGYTLLMPLAEGEDGHHVTNEYVIGIPADIHNSIGGRREKHRMLVLQWLKTHDKKKYTKVLCVLAKQ
jgi:hypothetical protein